MPKCPVEQTTKALKKDIFIDNMKETLLSIQKITCTSSLKKPRTILNNSIGKRYGEFRMNLVLAAITAFHQDSLERIASGNFSIAVGTSSLNTPAYLNQRRRNASNHLSSREGVVRNGVLAITPLQAMGYNGAGRSSYNLITYKFLGKRMNVE